MGDLIAAVDIPRRVTRLEPSADRALGAGAELHRVVVAEAPGLAQDENPSVGLVHGASRSPRYCLEARAAGARSAGVGVAHACERRWLRGIDERDAVALLDGHELTVGRIPSRELGCGREVLFVDLVGDDRADLPADLSSGCDQAGPTEDPEAPLHLAEPAKRL